MHKPLSDRIAVVTGASRGIGAAVAFALAERGAHVIAIARTIGALEELDDRIVEAGGSATLVPLDMKDHDGLVRLAVALDERHGRVDILVGNAAIGGPSSPLSHVEPTAWDDVIAVNLTANWHLIRSMDTLLRRSDAGRAVFVTSAASRKPRAYRGPYAASKAALDALARSYAAETANTHVRVNVFDPGPIRTRMRAAVMPGEDPATLELPDRAAEKLVELCLPSFTETGKLYIYPTRTLRDFPSA